MGIEFQSLASPHQERLDCTSGTSKPEPVTANTTPIRQLINTSRARTRRNGS